MTEDAEETPSGLAIEKRSEDRNGLIRLVRLRVSEK